MCKELTRYVLVQVLSLPILHWQSDQRTCKEHFPQDLIANNIDNSPECIKPDKSHLQTSRWD